MSSSVMPVQLPIFASSNGQPQASNAQTSAQHGWTNALQDGGGDDPLDFDLLAEYLLDDSPAADASMGLSAFDFSIDDATIETTPANNKKPTPEQETSANKRRRVTPAPAIVAPAMPPPGLVPGQFIMAQAAMNNAAARAMGGGRQKKSQAQIDRRRERNRILARRTRLRKKFFFESLQKEVIDLQKENMALKEIVRTRLRPEVSRPLLESCKAIEKLPPEIIEACGGEGIDLMDKKDFSLINSIQSSQQCFVITDPSLQDNPIVYASEDFLQLTGYSRDEVLGRNCRFLQGTETSPEKVKQIRDSVATGKDVIVTLVNYTSDGTAFWNNLFIAALRDANNNIVNYIGVIVKVASPEPGDPEANKRLPGQPNSDEDDDEAANDQQ